MTKLGMRRIVETWDYPPMALVKGAGDDVNEKNPPRPKDKDGDK